VEIFGWNFSVKIYSSREFLSLSSAALVNAVRLVQTRLEIQVACAKKMFNREIAHAGTENFFGTT
jgi:hypothetical protein